MKLDDLFRFSFNFSRSTWVDIYHKWTYWITKIILILPKFGHEVPTRTTIWTTENTASIYELLYQCIWKYCSCYKFFHTFLSNYFLQGHLVFIDAKLKNKKYSLRSSLWFWKLMCCMKFWCFYLVKPVLLCECWPYSSQWVRKVITIFPTFGKI